MQGPGVYYSKVPLIAEIYATPVQYKGKWF